MTASEIVTRAQQWVAHPHLNLLTGMTPDDITRFLAVVRELRGPARVRVDEFDRLRLRRQFHRDQQGLPS